MTGGRRSPSILLTDEETLLQRDGRRIKSSTQSSEGGEDEAHAAQEGSSRSGQSEPLQPLHHPGAERRGGGGHQRGNCDSNSNTASPILVSIFEMFDHKKEIHTRHIFVDIRFLQPLNTFISNSTYR